MKSLSSVWWYIAVGSVLFAGCAMYYYMTYCKESYMHLFPQTSQELQQRTHEIQERTRERVDALCQLSNSERTFDNTIRAFDAIVRDFGIVARAIFTTHMVHPDESVRACAQECVTQLQAFAVDTLHANKDVYDAIVAYDDQRRQAEDLTDEEARYMYETRRDFERAGLGLPAEQRHEVKRLQKEVQEVSLAFESAINSDDSHIVCTREDEVAGIQEAVRDQCRQEDGTYRFGVDYPTFAAVMQGCHNARTRERMYRAFTTRAHPENTKRLAQLRDLRDQLARTLGYESFAAYDIEDQMATSPQRVDEFVRSLVEKATPAYRSFATFLQRHRPEGVTLDESQRLAPWDVTYTITQYKRQAYQLDEDRIQEYFPVDHTLEQIFDIYATFLGVRFEPITCEGTWHEDVRAVAVTTQQGTRLATLLMDLHPRPGKYSHACQIGIEPARYDESGNREPATIVIIANFPKPHGDKPALLKRDDVVTFFHEFGHAMHSACGATHMAAFSGTNVKTDFVEVPSQMLEEWMYDADILKRVSRHYQTGEPLDDGTIANIQAVKNFDAAHFVIRQAALSLFSLHLYGPGDNVSIAGVKDEIRRDLPQDIPFALLDDGVNMEAAFGHLTGYGAKYYSYLWSKVYALDLFHHVAQHGLLDQKIGKIFRERVLAYGGSKNPHKLMASFLGREPSTKAFMEEMGLQT